MKRRIDDNTAVRVRQILMLCRSRGEDPVTTLSAAGFLRHPGSQTQDSINFLDFGVIPGVKALRIPPDCKTPLDTKNLILQALEGLRDDLAKEY